MNPHTNDGMNPNTNGCGGVDNGPADTGAHGGEGPGTGEFPLYWNVEVATFLRCASASYIHHQVSGPFGGFDVAQDVARDFAAKPGVLSVQLKPAVAEGSPHTPCAVPGAGPVLSKNQEDGIESLFLLLAGDRSLATYVKKHLERLGVWKRYEDRFLDLFSKRQG